MHYLIGAALRAADRAAAERNEVRYWIGVASKEHVGRGIAGGFCQFYHGMAQPLKRMSAGDWLVYYSPTEVFGDSTPCQKFTAIGKVVGDDVYSVEMSPGFVPYRRDVRFLPATDAPIQPLVDSLGFIRDKRRWGYAFRFGHLEISRQDFENIAAQMLGHVPLHDEVKAIIALA